MAKIRYVGNVTLAMVPALDRGNILPGQIVECPDQYVYNFTLQEIWQPHDKAAQKLHDEGAAAEAERLNPTPPAEPAEETPEG